MKHALPLTVVRSAMRRVKSGFVRSTGLPVMMFATSHSDGVCQEAGGTDDVDEDRLLHAAPKVQPLWTSSWTAKWCMSSAFQRRPSSTILARAVIQACSSKETLGHDF